MSDAGQDSGWGSGPVVFEVVYALIALAVVALAVYRVARLR
ncbi:hypothetical protein AB0D97_16375 [Streptomyces roseus]